MAFPDTVIPLTVEMLPTGDSWTDVTAQVRGGDPDVQTVTVTRGRRDETATVDPTDVSMTFDNRTGDFCPTNPSGAYFGKIGRGTPIRGYLPGTGAGLQVPVRDGSVLVNASPQYRQLFAGSRAAGTPLEAYASCPDSVPLSITGDLELQVEADLPDWGQPFSYLLGKYDTSTNQRSYRLSVGEYTAGRLGLIWSTDGSTYTSVESTQPLPQPMSGRRAVAVSFQVNVAGSYQVTFWYAASLAAGDAGGWTQLGDVLTGAATSIYDSTAIVQVGRWCTGTIFEARIYSGIHTGTHTLKANPIWSAQADGSTSLTDAQGNAWTCTHAQVVDRDYRFAAEVASWPIRWDVTGKDIYAPVSAAGVLRRLTAATSPVDSALYTGTLQETDLHDYWPCEDGSGASSIASATGSRPGTFTGTPSLSTDSAFPGSKPLPAMGTSVFTFWCTTSGDWSGGTVAVRMLVDGGQPITNGAVLLRVFTRGAVARWDLVYGTGGTLALSGYDNTGTSVLASGAVLMGVNNGPGWASIELTQSGTTCTGRMVWLTVGSDTASTWDTAITLAGGVGQPTIVQANATGNAGTSVGFGHVTTHNTTGSVFGLWRQLAGWDGEPAAERVVRVLSEHGISALVVGDGTKSAPMGVQPIDTVASILSACQEVDGGILYEPRDFVGICYRTSADMTACAQLDARGVTLTYSSAHLSSVQPTYDDLMSSNRWTASRSAAIGSGSSATATLASGPMSTAAPPDGIGERAKSVSVNVHVDGQLPDQAYWRLNLGTWAGERYPQVSVKLARPVFAGNATLTAAVAGLDVGDPLTVTGWDLSGYPPDDVEQLAVGYSEVMSNKQWDLTFNCVPAAPWQVGIYDDGVSRYDTEASALHADCTSGATSITVDTTSGPRWVTTSEDAGAFPLDVRIGGERITVSGISGTSNPQTFTLSARAVNGVTKAHTAGDAVSLYRPARYGMRF
jgi:hypothetical protein